MTVLEVKQTLDHNVHILLTIVYLEEGCSEHSASSQSQLVSVHETNLETVVLMTKLSHIQIHLSRCLMV